MVRERSEDRRLFVPVPDSCLSSVTQTLWDTGSLYGKPPKPSLGVTKQVSISVRTSVDRRLE